jgi:sec-independent protein translocase protein TatB
MFGLTLDKVMILAVIAVFLIGPQRLPAAAARLGKLIRAVRDMADGAKERMKEEMGPEFDEVDWVKLDPRQYDPRRIIRDALLDDSSPYPHPSAIPAARAVLPSADADSLQDPATARPSDASPAIERN